RRRGRAAGLTAALYRDFPTPGHQPGVLLSGGRTAVAGAVRVPSGAREGAFMPIDTLLLALTTFFASIGPADLLLVYAALTQKSTQAERRTMALRSTLIATAILLFFAVFGEAMLRLFGITLPALRIAGGILLLLIS